METHRNASCKTIYRIECYKIPIISFFRKNLTELLSKITKIVVIHWLRTNMNLPGKHEKKNKKEKKICFLYFQKVCFKTGYS